MLFITGKKTAHSFRNNKQELVIYFDFVWRMTIDFAGKICSIYSWLATLKLLSFKKYKAVGKKIDIFFLFHFYLQVRHRRKKHSTVEFEDLLAQ